MPKRQRLLLAVVCGVAVANVYAGQPVLDAIGGDLGLGPGALGWLVAVGQLGYLVGLVVLVPLGDVLDRRRLIAAHLALTAVGAAVTATAGGGTQAFAGLAVAGLFAVVVQTAVAYAASRSAPAERGGNIGVVTSGVVVGILGARVVSGALTGLWGWRSTYFALAIASTALAVVVLLVLPADERTARPDHRRAPGAFAGLARDRLFLGRGLVAFFTFASFGTLWSGLALPLGAAPWHLEPVWTGLFGLAGLVGALGAARAGAWADRGRAPGVTGWSLAALLASWPLTAMTGTSLWPLVVGVLVLDFAVQAVHVTNQHRLTTAHPHRTSTVIGGYMVFYSLGSALGAITTTAAYDAAGWVASSALGAGYAACALLVSKVDRPAGGVVTRSWHRQGSAQA
ncbi:MFS transporter [Saccharothrix sp. SC076]|nr:MFS transporter [Saccharothrix obliqua]